MGLHEQSGITGIKLCISPQVSFLIIFGVLLKKYILEFKSTLIACSQGLTRTKRKWTAPPLGVFKINVDGATSKNERNSSVRVVIRDAADNVHVACCKYLQGQYSVEEVEALTMECGLILAKEQKLSHV